MLAKYQAVIATICKNVDMGTEKNDGPTEDDLKRTRRRNELTDEALAESGLNRNHIGHWIDSNMGYLKEPDGPLPIGLQIWDTISKFVERKLADEFPKKK